MKLTIKTLKKGVSFEIDVVETLTVRQTKEAIQTLKGDEYLADTQKLIHQGKILNDDVSLGSAGVKEGDFIVCMVSKAAASSAPVSVSAPPITAPTPPVTVVTPPVTNTPVAPVPVPAAPVQNDAHVRQLVDMGFPEDQVRAALRAAFGNPDRAVEYLMTGIPAGVGAPSTSAPISTAPSTEIHGDDPLAALRALPQFEALRARVRANPADLAVVLQEIGRSNPALLTVIHNNQAAFVALMNEAPMSEGGEEYADDYEDGGGMAGEGGMPNAAQLAQMLSTLNPEQQTALAAQMGISPDQLRGFADMFRNVPPEMLNQMLAGAGGAGGLGAGGEGGAAPRDPTMIRVELTGTERAAVDRLVALGFTRDQVLEAFLICDRNEELAANYLFDSMGGGGF